MKILIQLHDQENCDKDMANQRVLFPEQVQNGGTEGKRSQIATKLFKKKIRHFEKD